MKTSKEIEQDIKDQIDAFVDGLIPYTTIKDSLAAYKSALCGEQREVCARMVSGWPTEIYTETEIQDRVADAPEPE